MKIKILYIFLVVGLVAGAFVVGRFTTSSDTTEFSIIPTPVPTPLAKYAIPTLQEKQVMPGEFELGDTITSDKKYTTSTFKMKFDPTLNGKETKTVSGVINMPVGDGPFPLIIMIRGYVDPNIYYSGLGSQPAASFFAKNDFITISPDFLGYAASDSEAGNIFETRFQTYTTVLTLFNSLQASSFAKITENKWDNKNLFMWAHSNGGQIALTFLSVTGAEIPTVLWAPVTKAFPYNVLYYTDESADEGKLIRKELSKFENLYSIDQYSYTNYLSNIKSPIEFDQGTNDDAVPYIWTREISTKLKKLGLEIVYNEYTGSDHNLRPVWNAVIQKNLEFFQKHIK